MEREKSSLVDFLLLPLRWLERSRGWRRRVLILVYAMVVPLIVLLAWREFSLWRLPNLPEPFDETRYGTVVVAEAENAMPLYKAADALLVQPGSKIWNAKDWSQLDPSLNEWVGGTRPALEAWLKATSRPVFLLIQPTDFNFSSTYELINSFRVFGRLAVMEANRRLDAGDPEGAWTYGRAVLRSSRHAGLNGSLIYRMVGNAVLKNARPALNRWIEDPAVTPALLRQAIRDVEVCRGMTRPISETIRIEYFAAKAALADPTRWRGFGINGPEGEANWYAHLPGYLEARHFLLHEPERSQRIHRLITAGVLAQIERPRWARPPLISPRFMIYATDARTPRPLNAIKPETLATLAENSVFASLAFDLDRNVLVRLESEWGDFDEFRIRMAERAYEIEQGKPAKRYADLLGYLAELPEGIEPGDPLQATSSSSIESK